MIDIIIAYAPTVETQVEFPIQVEPNCSVIMAIKRSGLLTRFPNIQLPGSHAVGIYGRRVALDAGVKAGDRIEIYRPLTHDPKETRRKRAVR